MRAIFALLLTLCLSACASSDDNETWGQEDYDANSTARGPAFRVDAMQVRKPMPKRPNWKPMEFYYKHCTALGEETFYSKTSYGCSDPY